MTPYFKTVFQNPHPLPLFQVFIGFEMVVLLASTGALIATRNIRRLESHVVVVLMGMLAFCFLLSSTNAAIFASAWMNADRNGQRLPKDGLSLGNICEDRE